MPRVPAVFWDLQCCPRCLWLAQWNNASISSLFVWMCWVCSLLLPWLLLTPCDCPLWHWAISQAAEERIFWVCEQPHQLTYFLLLMGGVFLMCADNWMESVSSDCYNFWHSSKTMDRVNYRMVEEDSWDLDCLTTDMKQSFADSFLQVFPNVP